MERRRFDESSLLPHSVTGGSGLRSSPPPRPPNYTCHRVQGALKHLASIDPLELCDEAKVEHCRATRDLRSCGRHVQSVLNSCGHASLCEECGQRCDVCPICRIPLPKDANRLRLRLYYECIEAGVISKRCDDRLQEKEDSDKQLVADIQRLYALFDAALENNLVSLICHYVTDVCMDESAVSSDPIIAFLLDEVVVKDWCRRTFNNILTEIQVIYNLTMNALKENLSLFLKFSVKLGGISNVIDVLESSFKGSLSAKLHDLHHLQESILKTKQHMEIMIWCIKHEFLENVKSRHKNYASWRALVRERKSAAIKRAWPDSVNHSDEYNASTLFIEDALSNIEAAEQGDLDDHEEDLALTYLQKDEGSLYSQSKIEGMAGCYPFESLRAAADILFLRGSSDLVVAKQAIFLYFMFDRQWTVPDEEWRHIIDDFAATFGVTRHSLLESFTFFLLDDEGVPALKEACQLLPEISSPTIHPKVAQILLERGNPDAALMVLRWSGQDGTQLISLREAVTAVRVRVECGLLTEAFTYQRLICAKINEKKLRDEQFQSASAEVEDQCTSWGLWVETLVTEICCLCIRRNLVDRMIELPWTADEEKHLHKCLLDFAAEDPSTPIGSLLVVFYLQRHRYVEAYQVDQKLQSMEEFISQNSVSEEILGRIRSINHWRTCLVDKGVELLPDILQQQIRTGKLPEVVVTCNDTVNISERSNAVAQEPIMTSLLANPPTDSSLIQRVDVVKPSVLDAPSALGGSLNLSSFKIGHYSSPSSPAFFNDAGVLKPESILGKKLKFDEIWTPASRRVNPPAPVMKITRNSSVEPSISRLRNSQIYRVSPEKSQNGLPKESYIFDQTAGNNVNSLSSNRGILTHSVEDSYMSYPGKRLLSDAADRSRMLPLNDSMDVTWSHEEKGPSTVYLETNGGPRWRSDDTSEDEEIPSLDVFAVSSAHTSRVVRRSRRIARR